MKHKMISRIMKAVSLSLVAAMSVGLFASCRTNNLGEMTYVVGEFAPLTTEDAYAALVNDSGMSGLEAPNHLHGTDTEDMYYSDTAESIVFDAGIGIRLGQLFVWNYNDPDNLNSGVRELRVEYSMDGQNYTELGTFELGMNSADDNNEYGGNVAVNKDSSINFGGVAGRYIRLTPVSNHGGSGYGLSEIRLFKHKIRPQAGQAVPYEAFTPNAEDDHPENLALGLGMENGGTGEGKVSNDPNNMWYVEGNRAEALLILSLDGTYPIDKLVLWNYNDPEALQNGIQELKIWYTTGEPCAIENTTDESGNVIEQSFDFLQGDWIPLEIGDDVVIKQGTGKDGMKSSVEISFNGVQVQHIKIRPDWNYEDPTNKVNFGLAGLELIAGKGWAVEPSREWTGLFSTSGTFDYTGANTAYRGEGPNSMRQGGWIGADGCNSYALDGTNVSGKINDNSKILFTFQDTAIGDFNNYQKSSTNPGYDMIHSGWVNMSYMYLTGDEPDVRNVQFVLAGEGSENHPYGNIFAKHYWVGDGVIIDDYLYVNANMYEGWDTEAGSIGNDWVRVKLGEDGFPDLSVVPEVVKDMVSKGSDPITFEAVLENLEGTGMPNPDGYIYIYGRREGKLVVARALPEDFKNYDLEYWNGKEWSKDLQTVIDNEGSVIGQSDVGNEGNVVAMTSGMFAGQYLNISTVGSVGGVIQMSTSTSLNGQGAIFSKAENIYYCSERYKIPMQKYGALNQWNYNAKAHPSISKEGELMISYHFGTQQMSGNQGIEYAHPWFVCLYEIQ